MDGGKGAEIMKRDAVGRVSYTAQQREALLDEFERSGLKGAQFALAAGVKYQTFAHWLQQRRHARGDYAGEAHKRPAALRLVEAMVAGGGDRSGRPPFLGQCGMLVSGGKLWV